VSQAEAEILGQEGRATIIQGRQTAEGVRDNYKMEFGN